MSPLPVILIFDVGKTNKKVILFDTQYKLVLEKTDQLPETTDEDGDPCEDVNRLSCWILQMFREVSSDLRYELLAVNISAYGASFVHLDDQGRPAAPLYNYLKPFPENLSEQFYDTYGGKVNFSKVTASPVLGNLNSGMQLYRLKYQKPEIYSRIRLSLHLPQFISYLITRQMYSDITSIGCHTALWDFNLNDYHEWVRSEGVDVKLAPVCNGEDVVQTTFGEKRLPVGVGLHDSSAALIPYLACFQEPFVLISTGTWSISLNPFNQSPLSLDELKKDCLFYLAYKGDSVKASRLFAGYEHDEQTRRMAVHFRVNPGYYREVAYDRSIIAKIISGRLLSEGMTEAIPVNSLFRERDLSEYTCYEEAYHHLMYELIMQQFASTRLILQDSPVKRIFVDGGFSRNPVYMHLLARVFPGIEVYAASVAQATAMGAALAIHRHWNKRPLPDNIIDLKYYTHSLETEL